MPDDPIQAAIRAARDQAEQVLTTATAQEAAGGTAPDTWQALQNAWEELRVSEDELARQSERLAELHNRQPLLSVLDRAGAAAVVTDEHGRVLRATDGARRTLGLRGSGGVLTRGMSRPVARRFRDALAQAKLAPGTPIHDVFTGDVSDPARMWVLCAVTPHTEGEPVRAVWIVHAEPGGNAVRPDEAVRGIARLRVTADSLHGLLAHLSQYVTGAVAGADGASVTLLSPGSLGATGEAVEVADRMQYRLREGPCYAALRTGETQWTGTADDDARWPRLSAAVAAADGFRSVLAVPLFAGTDVQGVLNVYAREPDAFGETELRIARILAGPVAASLADARVYTEQSELVAGLQQAIESHRRIGQATGILMVREGLDADAAFALLRRYSNDGNRKLRDIAAEIVAAAGPGST